MKLIPIPRKKKSLRAIDQGTRYDIAGNLRRFARSIERGEEKDLRDVMLITSRNLSERMPQVSCYHYGKGTIQDAHFMVSTAKNRMEPS